MYIAFIIIIVGLFIDQFTKFLAKKFLKPKKSIKMTKNFTFYYLENSGAANGTYSGNYFILLFATFFTLGICTYLFKYYDLNNNFLFSISLCIFIAGVLGNFLDRVIFSYVTDFISIRIFKKDLPVLNIADIYIFVGILLLLIAYFCF